MDEKSARPRGRPRTFDRDDVLDRAVITFWSKGYNGASMDDLTENMGINRPSLYATFGSKHELYLAAIDRYAATHGGQPVEAFLTEPDIRQAVAAFFEATIRCVTSRDRPKGCLIANVATEDAEIDDLVRDRLSVIFAETDRVVGDRFHFAQDEGQLSRDSNPQALAGTVIAIMHSFAARARVGASREELSRLAKDFAAFLIPPSA